MTDEAPVDPLDGIELLLDALGDDGVPGLHWWTQLLQYGSIGLYESVEEGLRVEAPSSKALPDTPHRLRALASCGLLPLGEPDLLAVESAVEQRVGRPEPTTLIPFQPDDPFLKFDGGVRRYMEQPGLRILIVATLEIAGQARLLLKAINTYTPHAARLVQFRGDYLNYPGGDILLTNGPPAIAEAEALADKADLFHCIRHPDMLEQPDPAEGSLGWADRFHRHNPLVQYYGTRLRENPTMVKGWHEATGILGLSAWDWTMLDRSWMPYHVPLLCDVEAMGSAAVYRGRRPLKVCHPTTRRDFKRTDVFLRAVEEAKAQGANIEGVLIEGVSNAECLAIKRRCHVTFDQLSVGIHGMSGVESMAMGHAVLGGISPFSLSVHPDLPVVRVTEHTLASTLVDLAASPERLQSLRQHSRDWARRYHSLSVVAARLTHLYEHVRTGNLLLPPPERLP